MDILKEINVSRRALMHNITKGIGGSGYNKRKLVYQSEIKNILISRPNNRLGNLLMITPLVEELTETFPHCTIDLFVKGNLAPVIFKNYKNVDNVIELPGKPFRQLLNYVGKWMALKDKRYDLVINIDPNSSSGRLSTWFASSKYKIFGDLSEGISDHGNDRKHMAKIPVCNLRDWLEAENHKSVPLLNLKLSQFELLEGRQTLRNLVNNNRPTICLFTYATGDKCYPENWWNDCYDRLLQEYDDYNIIEILPMHNASQIGFRAPAFYSRNIRQIGSLVANTEVFIGADSGMMHLASAAHVPTVGLFSVTDAEKYQPYGNNSLAINTTITDTEASIRILNNILFKKMACAN